MPFKPFVKKSEVPADKEADKKGKKDPTAIMLATRKRAQGAKKGC